ncbi:hypothetical protein K7432_015824 [Basidiobolus ranarum]
MTPLSPDNYNLFVTEGKVNLAVNCQSQYDVEKALRSKNDVIHLHPSCQALHKQVKFYSVWVTRFELVKRASICINFLLLYTKPCQNFWSNLTKYVWSRTHVYFRANTNVLEACKRFTYVHGVYFLVRAICSGLKYVFFHRFGWWRLSRYIYVTVNQDGEDQHFLVNARLRQVHPGIAPNILRSSCFRSIDVINTASIIAATNFVMSPLQGIDF